MFSFSFWNTLHNSRNSVRSQKTWIFSNTSVRNSKLTTARLRLLCSLICKTKWNLEALQTHNLKYCVNPCNVTKQPISECLLERKYWKKICVLIFSKIFVWNIYRSTKNSEILSQTYLGLHVKYRYSCQILFNINFVGRFPKNPQILNFVRIYPGGGELFHANGKRDRRKGR
jgi:hypothetical protein